jgi:hypothetical protein
MIESSVRNDINMQPDAIMSRIKQSQEHQLEDNCEKNYIIEDADLDMERLLQDDGWMYETLAKPKKKEEEKKEEA